MIDQNNAVMIEQTRERLFTSNDDASAEEHVIYFKQVRQKRNEVIVVRNQLSEQMFRREIERLTERDERIISTDLQPSNNLSTITHTSQLVRTNKFFSIKTID